MNRSSTVMRPEGASIYKSINDTQVRGRLCWEGKAQASGPTVVRSQKFGTLDHSYMQALLYRGAVYNG